MLCISCELRHNACQLVLVCYKARIINPSHSGCWELNHLRIRQWCWYRKTCVLPTYPCINVVFFKLWNKSVFSTVCPTLWTIIRTQAQSTVPKVNKFFFLFFWRADLIHFSVNRLNLHSMTRPANREHLSVTEQLLDSVSACNTFEILTHHWNLW